MLGAAACGDADGDRLGQQESDFNEGAKRLKGNAIGSPTVDPAKMYWGRRSIAILDGLGALSPVELSVAKRADGILANGPPNGYLGARELAALELRLDTLFPDERTAIPRLWTLFELGTATDIAPATGPTISVASRVDTYPRTPRPALRIASTVTEVARRIQLKYDSDGDPTTITGADVANADLDRASYLPEEALAFKQIVRDLLAQVEPIAAGAQSITLDLAPLPDTVLQQTSDVTVTALAPHVSVEPGGLLYKHPVTNETLRPAPPKVTRSCTAGVTVSPRASDVRIVVFFEAENQELLLPPQGGYAPSARRVEVWKGGARVGELEVVEPIGPLSATLALPEGYALQLPGKPLLLPNYEAEQLAYGHSTYWSVVADWLTPQLTPRPKSRSRLPSGSYFFDQKPGARVDIFENGRTVVIDPAGVPHECLPSTFKEGSPTTMIVGCRTFDAGFEGILVLTDPQPSVGAGWFGGMGWGGLYPY